MKLAKNSQGVLVLASQAKSNIEYFCPNCCSRVCLKISPRGHHFFAHVRKSRDNLIGESQEHQLGKQQIYSWLTKLGYHPHLEVYLQKIKQRPDIIFKLNSQVIVVEFQCSPLTFTEIQRRNRGYKSLGIQVWWILGKRYTRRLHLTKQAQFMQVNKHQIVLYYWNVQHAQLVIDRNLSTISLANRCLSKGHILKSQTKALYRYFQTKQTYLINLAYQHHHILCCCPLFAHDTQPQLQITAESRLEWLILILLTMEQFPIGHRWALSAWYQFLIQQIHWLEFPCLPNSKIKGLRLNTIDDITKTLQRANIIKMSDQLVIYNKCAQWFNSFDQKMNWIANHYLDGKY